MLFKRMPLFYDKNILDYCMKSTQESIKKIAENKSLESEKINQMIKSKLEDCNDNKKPKNNFNFFLVFLSVSSLGLFLYRKIK
jgi:hypothetical protein